MKPVPDVFNRGENNLIAPPGPCEFGWNFRAGPCGSQGKRGANAHPSNDRSAACGRKIATGKTRPHGTGRKRPTRTSGAQILRKLQRSADTAGRLMCICATTAPPGIQLLVLASRALVFLLHDWRFMVVVLVGITPGRGASFCESVIFGSREVLLGVYVMSYDHFVGAFSAWDRSIPDEEIVGGTRAFWSAKRLFDVGLSLALLPLFGFFAIVLLLLNPFLNRGSLFFVQQRMGQFGEPFPAIKFRSMTPAETITRNADDPIETHRITPLGELMRKMRIDELPQVINVLKGEMSLIGPRPDCYHHAQEYVAAIPEYYTRHAIRPGISGLAQVTLGYAEGIEATRAKASADLAYVRNAGFVMDAKILWLTLVTILLRRGA